MTHMNDRCLLRLGLEIGLGKAAGALGRGGELRLVAELELARLYSCVCVCA